MVPSLAKTRGQQGAHVQKSKPSPTSLISVPQTRSTVLESELQLHLTKCPKLLDLQRERVSHRGLCSAVQLQSYTWRQPSSLTPLPGLPISSQPTFHWRDPYSQHTPLTTPPQAHTRAVYDISPYPLLPPAPTWSGAMWVIDGASPWQPLAPPLTAPNHPNRHVP